MSCSWTPGTSTAAKEPAGASSSRARSSSQSWKARKKLQEQEGTKGEGGGWGGRWPAAASVFGDLREDELHRLPDRSFLNGATEAACLYTQQGKKGTNQDAMIVWEGRDLVIGNLGDSRAVMGTRDKHNNLIAVELTVDLKPNLPKAARIQQCKGRVFALQDEPEVARVWLPNSDSPGLAMARAFGDFCLKDYGLISVWDVLSNKEAVDIIASAPTRGTAARALVDCAVRAWRLKFPTSKIDDCAVVCLYLDNPSSSDQSHKVHSKKSPIQPAPSTDMNFVDEAVIDDSIAGGAQVHASPLERSHTLVDADEIVPVSEVSKVPRVAERSQSSRSLADCISATEEEEWSALEGVTRVNSLLNLPRILSGDKGSTSRKKWF
ncbi:hypothetical protein GW17_00004626 [Ensete ventricosum]|nr:hypothetical protein GW17_00004626 [Ensete ventricosum]RZS18000.1 hypothetical protein BHM03_00050213 [Ensete ventricosum]